MIYHPTIIILTSILVLILSYRKEKLFASASLIMPIIAAITLYTMPTQSGFEFFNLNLVCEGTPYNKLIGFAFLLVLFSANLYALGQKKKLELMLGSAYAASTLCALFAGDFISMFVGIELMMIFSAAIIFIGGRRKSLRSAKKYFLTHLMSSNMIVIGIVHIITKEESIALIPVVDLLTSPKHSHAMIIIMLTGMLINIAAFPFSGWMVNYYPKASPAGFLYLISFTTKLSIMLLIKLFTGYESLKYIAAIMIIYASIKAVFEDRLQSLLCYLSIMAMGLMLLGISHGSPLAILATVSYLFIHIIYKALLSISISSIIDHTGIKKCHDLQRINCKLTFFAIITGIAIMINIPILSSFYVKSTISHLYEGTIFYNLTIFLTAMTIITIPWKKYLHAKESMDINLNKHASLSILFMLIVALIVGISASTMPIIGQLDNFRELLLFSQDTLNQGIIIIAALFVTLIYALPRKKTYPINLTEYLGDVFFYCYWRLLKNRSKEDSSKEPWMIHSLERQITSKINAIHNQQTAIFIVFAGFVILLGASLALS
ncbi:MAG: hypothetical protein COA94_03750 [Rickettsiales bacterium]|nr:MAG: hypothetical protein COA94_03750 [Rickettsiales bacterium]